VFNEITHRLPPQMHLKENSNIAYITNIFYAKLQKGVKRNMKEDGTIRMTNEK
jgi:hypothetical protein